VVAQKEYEDWKKKCAEERAQKRELEKNPPKPTYIMQQELRRKLTEVKSSVSHIRLAHYRTMNALSASHIRRMLKRGEQGKMLHSSGSNLSNLSTR
jgi:L-lactate utilization protein LutC